MKFVGQIIHRKANNLNDIYINSTVILAPMTAFPPMQRLPYNIMFRRSYTSDSGCVSIHLYLSVNATITIQSVVPLTVHVYKTTRLRQRLKPNYLDLGKSYYALCA